MVSHRSILVTLAAGFSCADAFWRMACDSTLTTERLDPIISPGGISGHVHNVAGGSNFGPSADYPTMRKSACTSCPIAQDLSAYWTPELYYQYENGSFISLPGGGGTTVYYLQRSGNGDGPIKAFPEGFRMISGNPTLRTYDSTSREQQAINFVCLDYKGGSSSYDMLPPKNCPDGLRLQVAFPSCWDGVHLDTADHKSHMAFPSGITSGNCDNPAFPVRLITIFYEIFYSPAYFKDMWYGSGQPFVLAMGDKTGYGMHGDFLNGWDVNVLQQAVDTCTDNSGSIDICKPFTIKHPVSGNLQCHKSPSVDEVVTDVVLDTLPGCNPVTTTAAAALANMIGTCSKPLPTLWTNTTGYYGTVVPPGYNSISNISTVESYKNWNYIGCYQDGSPRVFPTRYSASNVEQCLDLCQKNSFTYGGMEWGRECWCGTSLNNAKELSYQNCAMPCTGDSSEYCGDSMTLTTYKLGSDTASVDAKAVANTKTSATGTSTTAKVAATTSTPTASSATSASSAKSSPLSWTYSGCYTDAWARTLRYQQKTNATVEACQAACGAAGYSVAGLENWTQCFCDNAIQSTGTLTDSSQCNYPCDQAHNEICGGSWRLSVYSGTSQGSSVSLAASPPSSSSSSSSSSSATTTTAKSGGRPAFVAPIAASSSSAKTASASSTTKASAGRPSFNKPVSRRAIQF